jgi:uncharacterized membrane protein YidH (DUF202 family)
MRALGVVLIVIGLVGLIYGGVRWTHRDKVVDLGPIEVTQEKHESVPLPPVAGAICLIGGVTLLLTQSRRAH